MNKKPDLIIFDMDGLMFDTENLFMNYLIETASEHGYIFTKELYLKTIGTSGDNLKRIVSKELGYNYPLKQISQITRDKISKYTDNNIIPVKPGLIELLEYIKDNKIHCCIASSTSKRHIEHYLKNTSLSDYFEHIISGDMVLHSKPDPEIFLLACKKCNATPNCSLVLEDSRNGIIAASLANIPVICIPDLIIPDKLMYEKSLAIYESLHQVIDLLKSTLN